MHAEKILELETQPAEKIKADYISNTSNLRIKSKDEIHGFLKKLFKNHALLSVTVGDSPQVFGSVILEINKQDCYFVLDELYPRDELEFSLLEQTLSIETHLQGVLLQFTTSITAISEKDGGEFYKAHIPKNVFHHQRRENYRVPIRISEPLPLDLATGNDVLLHAEIRNLSLGGLSARLTTTTSERLEKGTVLPTCIIQVPQADKIICSLEIVRVEETRSLNKKRFGARFNDLSNTARPALTQIISKIQRQHIKILRRQGEI